MHGRRAGGARRLRRDAARALARIRLDRRLAGRRRGRVWALDQNGGGLHVLDPATGRTLEQVSVGETGRFATPAIYSSMVLVPAFTGVVYVRTS